MTTWVLYTMATILRRFGMLNLAMTTAWWGWKCSSEARR